MRSIRTYILLTLVALISATKVGFAFSSGSANTVRLESFATVKESSKLAFNLHFATDATLDTVLPEALMDFEEEEEENKKKLHSFYFGHVAYADFLEFGGFYSKSWTAHRKNRKLSNSIRYHLLLRKIQI